MRQRLILEVRRSLTELVKCSLQAVCPCGLLSINPEVSKEGWLRPGDAHTWSPRSNHAGLHAWWACRTVPVLELGTSGCLCLDPTDWKIGFTWLTSLQQLILEGFVCLLLNFKYGSQLTSVSSRV